MRKDIVVSSVLLAGVIALYLSLSLMDDPRAVIFPRVIILVMGVLSLLLLAQSVLVRGKGAEGEAGDGFPFGRFSGCFVLILAYFFFMERLGFYVSAFLFFVVVTLVLGSRGLTIRKGAGRVAAGAAFTAVLYVLFNRLLAVQTPKGILF
ncbi:MAG: tripartite tricarboxylate transporter TctB family protein [Deltaproteobacteria bacterium]|nr:tripartite tricarboxylate transporter TctB family protein [Deltaproteobacteria bacterium]